MLEATVVMLLGAAGAYVAAGLVVATAIQLWGLGAIDPTVEAGSSCGFRLLITPGLVAFWPLLMVRWWRAAHGDRRYGEADSPVAAAGLRRRHRRLATGLAVVIPVLAGVGLTTRPAAPPADRAARDVVADSMALPEVLGRWTDVFGSLPIDIRLRGDRDGALQLELEVARDLELPALVALWSPAGVARDEDGRVFLCAVWGPGVRRTRLPAEAGSGGEVTLYSMARREIVAVWRMPAIGGSAPPGPKG